VCVDGSEPVPETTWLSGVEKAYGAGRNACTRTSRFAWRAVSSRFPRGAQPPEYAPFHAFVTSPAPRFLDVPCHVPVRGGSCNSCNSCKTIYSFRDDINSGAVDADSLGGGGGRPSRTGGVTPIRHPLSSQLMGEMGVTCRASKRKRTDICSSRRTRGPCPSNSCATCLIVSSATSRNEIGVAIAIG